MLADAEDVRGHHRRIELHVIAWSRPVIARFGQLVVYLEALGRRDAERAEIEVEPSRMTMMDIHVHDDEHGRIRRRIALREAEELIVVATVEHERLVVLERWLLLADAIHDRDDLAEAVRAIDVPVLQLVLLVVD